MNRRATATPGATDPLPLLGAWLVDGLEAAALSGRLGFTVDRDGTGPLVVVTLPNVGELRAILAALDAGGGAR